MNQILLLFLGFLLFLENQCFPGFLVNQNLLLFLEFLVNQTFPEFLANQWFLEFHLTLEHLGNRCFLECPVFLVCLGNRCSLECLLFLENHLRLEFLADQRNLVFKNFIELLGFPAIQYRLVFL